MSFGIALRFLLAMDPCRLSQTLATLAKWRECLHYGKRFSHRSQLGHWPSHCEITRRSRARSVGHVTQPGTHSEDAAIASGVSRSGRIVSPQGQFSKVECDYANKPKDSV